MPRHPLHHPVFAWFTVAERPLPWRESGTTAWGVLVSEVMSHQTPVSRVEPVWREWMCRWPTPLAQSRATPAEVIQAWGRLGYPRRALRLRECAFMIATNHGGAVPTDEASLRELPGIGSYTAAAIRAFAYHEHSVVLDTNIRRVLARAVSGHEYPARSVTKVERSLAETLIPDEPVVAARWNAAVMELGALVCTSRSPACAGCPIASECAWLNSGKPKHTGPPRVGQAWHGTDRQARGRIMATLRNAERPVSRSHLLAIDSHSSDQLKRCINSLVSDGLMVRCTNPDTPARYELPRS